MTDSGGFLVEDFIQSITAQLDRVQDVLRLKAQTRPLTYALKDFSLDLNVFVDMDIEGNVRFRAGGANESGASVVRLGFTTITKPMIEENTVALSMTTSPTLDELGMEREEQRRLGQLGIRNAAQLQQLRHATSTNTIARYTGVPIDRLRHAMRLGQPFIQDVQPDRSPVEPQPQPRPPTTKPPTAKPPTAKPPVTQPPTTRPPVQRPPQVEVSPGRLPVARPPLTIKPEPPERPARADLPQLIVQPDTRRLRIGGGNLLGPNGPPTVRLAGRSLPVDVLDDDEMVVQLPEEHRGGALEIALPHGETVAFALNVDSPTPSAGAADTQSFDDGDEPAGWAASYGYDPWSPDEGGTV